MCSLWQLITLITIPGLPLACCDINLYGDTEQSLCEDQKQEYWCSVTGSRVGVSALTWKILDTNGTDFGGSVTYNSANVESSEMIGGIFTAEQISQDPLESKISFTGQRSIEGYTIVCENTVSLTNVESANITIEIDLLDPGNVIIDGFTSSSVTISWTGSHCATEYRYNISSSALEKNIIEYSTNKSVIMEGLVPSDDQYCVVVTAINQQNFTTVYEPRYFILNGPPQYEIDCKLVSCQVETICVICYWWTNSSIDNNMKNIYSSKITEQFIALYTVDGSYEEIEFVPPNRFRFLFNDTGISKSMKNIITVVAELEVNNDVDSTCATKSFVYVPDSIDNGHTNESQPARTHVPDSPTFSSNYSLSYDNMSTITAYTESPTAKDPNQSWKTILAISISLFVVVIGCIVCIFIIGYIIRKKLNQISGALALIFVSF